jgi:hypothetical protein
MSYLSNKDYYHFRCAGKKTYGSHIVINHRLKYATDIWKSSTENSNFYLGIEKNIFLDMINTFGLYIEAFEQTPEILSKKFIQEILEISTIHFALTGTFLVSSTFIPFALTSYGMGAVLSTCGFILGGTIDTIECARRFTSTSYPGINALFPSQSRRLKSERPEHNLDITLGSFYQQNEKK